LERVPTNSTCSFNPFNSFSDKRRADHCIDDKNNLNSHFSHKLFNVDSNIKKTFEDMTIDLKNMNLAEIRELYTIPNQQVNELS
jgi:hypothetical protein